MGQNSPYFGHVETHIAVVSGHDTTLKHDICMFICKFHPYDLT